MLILYLRFSDSFFCFSLAVQAGALLKGLGAQFFLQSPGGLYIFVKVISYRGEYSYGI